MSKWVRLSAVVLALIVVASLLWLHFFSHLRVVEVPASLPESGSMPAPNARPVTPTLAVPSNDEEAPDELASEPPVYADQGASAALQTQQRILSYPSYAQPYEFNGPALLDWNQAYPVEMPILDGREQLALVLSQYYFMFPEPITGRVNASTDVSDVRIELIDVDTQQVLANSSGMQFTISTQEGWPRELRVRAYVRVAGAPEQVSADLQFHIPSAHLDAIESANVQGTDWVARARLDVKRAGIFRLRAVLETAQGQRLAVITAEERLDIGRQSMWLKAHHSVLPSQPETLFINHVVLERMSSYPGDLATYGTSAQARWPLGQLQPSLLDTQPYQPDANEQRQLEFLRRWAG